MSIIPTATHMYRKLLSWEISPAKIIRSETIQKLVLDFSRSLILIFLSSFPNAEFLLMSFSGSTVSMLRISSAASIAIMITFIMISLRQLSSFSTLMNASCGTSTVPSWRIRFLPSFCFSRSFFLRVISPP